jgi:hypothetical protein
VTGSQGRSDAVQDASGVEQRREELEVPPVKSHWCAIASETEGCCARPRVPGLDESVVRVSKAEASLAGRSQLCFRLLDWLRCVGDVHASVPRIVFQRPALVVDM